MTDTTSVYDLDAAAFAALYESVAAESVHATVAEFIPRGVGLLALDVGAGSGRDAAWLVSLGFDVVAVEPARGMREEAKRLHPETRIRWLDDRLPDLHAVYRLGLTFDLVLLTGVWMHISPPTRGRAFRKLVTLLKPGGVMLISVREGPPDPARPMWPAPIGELEMYARIHGVAVLRSDISADLFGRPHVRWTNVCLRLPDDSTGALPLLRGVILKEDKSSTYKLGLLRAVARIADSQPGLGIPRADEDVIDVPLGLVALNWLRMYLPLVLAKLPQAPGNSGPDGLTFAKAGFRELLTTGFAAQDLRIGTRFAGERAQAIVRALVEARRTITEMPANYTRFPNSDARVFTAAPKTPFRFRGELMLDGEFLSSFGNLTVPGHIWRTLQRMGAWIEPVLIGEWARLVCNYGERMGRAIDLSEVEGALVWLDSVRDTNLARTIARRLINDGHLISCVWTGTRLGVGGAVLDIDHCLPWSAWPCGDLWNLLPASRRVNQHLKRHRLPSMSVLAAARERIVAWWEIAWRSDPALGVRFDRESAAALPIHEGAASEDVFAALEWRRLRLRLDQQVEEWTGGGQQRRTA